VTSLTQIASPGATSAQHRSPLSRLVDMVPSWIAVLLCGCLVGLSLRLGIEVASILVVGIAVACFALSRPVEFTYAVIAIVPITPGLRRGLPVPGLRLSELLVAGAATLILVSAGRASWSRWGSIDWWGLLFVTLYGLLGAEALLRRGIGLDSGSVGDLFGVAQFFLLYRIVRIGLRNEAQRARGLQVLLWASLPVSLLTFLQQLDVGPVRVSITTLTASVTAPTSGYTGIVRATGPFAHYHSLAGYLVVILLAAASVILVRDQRMMPRRHAMFIAACASLALLYTATLIAIVGAAVGALALAMRTGQLKRVGILALTVTTASFFIIGDNLQRRLSGQFEGTLPTYTLAPAPPAWLPVNVAFRVEVWRGQYLPVIWENLLLGFGPGTPPSVTWPSTESLYISLLLHGGVLLLLAYLGFLISVWLRGHAAERLGAGVDSIVGHTLTAVVVAMTVMQTLHPYFTDAGFPHAMWIVLALLPMAGRLPSGTRPKARTGR